jgi:hypothetical protein
VVAFVVERVVKLAEALLEELLAVERGSSSESPLAG